MPEVIEEIQEQSPLTESFRDRMTNAFIAADIPLNKLNNPVLRKFLTDEIPHQKLPHSSTLRRNLKKLYLLKMKRIKNYFRNEDVFFIVDESPDCESRNVVNVIVGQLNGKKPNMALLSVEYPTKVNDVTIRKIILNACNKIWKGKNQYPQLKLVISDQASYMLSALRKMKEEGVIFPNTKHITCVVHSISNLCRAIQESQTTVNLFTSNLKKFFKNSPKRKNDFKDKTGLRLPPFPIQIRFGSWLTCIKYLLEEHRWEKIKKFFLEFDVTELHGTTGHFESLQRLFKLKKLETDLINLSKYTPIAEIITKLEAKDLTKDEQFGLLEQVKNIVKGTVYEQKFNSSLDKNPDLISFFDTSNSLTDREKRIFCPITSCEVERSFSVYKSILSDRRRNFLPSNLAMTMIIKYNQRF